MAVGRRSEVHTGTRARRSEPWPERGLRQEKEGRGLARADALCSSPRRRTFNGYGRGSGAAVMARKRALVDARIRELKAVSKLLKQEQARLEASAREHGLV